MKRIFTKLSLLVAFCILTVSVAFAQTTVKGKVTDGRFPIPGAGVTVKGTTTATVTNADGDFTISVPANGTLVFTYIGFSPREVAITNQTTLNISMVTSAQDLEQVVVVGFGTQKRKDLTGSITSVSGDEIAKMPALSPLASLQGKVPGLTIVNSGGPGAAPVVRIRGISSTTNANPLYVVDGLLQDDISYLNTGDIETIDLLRDASSSAIYGLRGANGVIAITTKRAARGQTRVSLQSNVGIQRVNDRIDVADAAGFKKLYNAQLANLGAAPFDYTNYTADTDWQDLIFRNAVINTNTLSISNSGEKSTTLVSLGYNNQDGVVRNDNLQRYILRLNEEIKVTDNFKIGGDITGVHSVSNPTPVSLNNAIWSAPIVGVKDDQNRYYAMPSFQRAQVGNAISSLDRSDGSSVNKAYRFAGSLFGELKFLKDFTLRSTIYADVNYGYNRSYSPPPFTIINLGEGAAPTTYFYDNNFRSSVSQSQNEGHKYQQDHTLTYEKEFTGGHRLTALAGFTSIRFASSNVGGSRQDGDLIISGDPDLWYLGVVNTTNPNNISTNFGGGNEETNAGGFARISYAYKNKYLFNGTIRRDGSSRFAPKNRWGTFGSAGFGWVASEEDFFKNNVKGIDYLKLRVAYGRLGNSNGVGANLYQVGINSSSSAVFGENVYSAISPQNEPDPNLRFEVVEGVDAGIDIKALNSRFNAEINLYSKTTDGLLTSFLPLNGVLNLFTNLGKVNNRGIELSMGWSDKIGKDLSYNISGNFSYNRNRIISLGNATNFQILGNGGVNVTETGKSIGHFFGYTQIGIYQTPADIANNASFANSLPGDIRYKDTNGDGAITPADREDLGTPFPPYSFGLNLSLGYKGFDFLVEGQGVAGNKIYTQRRTSQFAVLNYEANRMGAWTSAGSTNIEPILDNARGNNYLFSTYYLEKGDYFRLRTVQLGYTFTKANFGKLPVQRVRLYISGQNIKTWTKATGYTPEAQIGSITGGGADNGVYPVPAIYSFGLNVTF